MHSRLRHPFANLPTPTPGALLAYGLWLRLAIGGAFLAAAGLALLLEPPVRWDLVLVWIAAGAALAILSWQRATSSLGRLGEQLGATPQRAATDAAARASAANAATSLPVSVRRNATSAARS